MKKGILKIFFIIFLLIISVLTFYFYQKIKAEPEFEIIFLNVGQGNSTLIKYKGKNILIDTGKEVIGENNLRKKLSFFNKKLDLIFITHFDIDHCGSLLNYLENYFISDIFSSSKTIDNILKKDILAEIKKRQIFYTEIEKGNNFIFDDNFKILILYPDKFFSKFKADNDSSLVLKIIYKDKSVLISGDLPSKMEKYLVQKYSDELKSDIFVAGHHGSNSSNLEEFLKAVNPKWIIFSVGKDNSYGHPHKEVLDRVKKINIKYFRTDEVGNIEFWLKEGDWVYSLEK